jgi:hypothetical protein
MTQRSPTLEGFRVLFSRPAFGLAEIAWRWSFGAAATLLLGFSFFEYLNTLPVSNSDLLLLRTAQPVFINQAVQHIFRGSGFRVIETVVVLALTLGVAWVVVASMARAATLKALTAHFRENNSSASHQQETKNGRLGSLFVLNFLRLGTTLAATVGLLAAVLLGGAASTPTDPAPGSALLIILTITMLVWLAWSTLNWILSLAPVFVVADGQDTFGAIAAAVDLCQTRSRSLFAAGTWFGLAHLTAFVVASSLAAFPLGFAAVLPPSVVFGGVLLVALLYSAIADFLYIGRLAAYVAIVEMPESPVIAETAPRPLPQRSPGTQPGPAVDASELILSDVPAST